MRALPIVGTVALLLLSGAARADATRPGPGANKPDEPVAKNWSLARSAAFLDASSSYWLDKHKCAACHTHYPYVLAGPAFGKPSPGLQRIRTFLKERVAGWDKGAPPDPGSEGVTEIVATAASLAFHDAATTGKLDPLTRQALQRMWKVQQPNGAWDWNKHRLPPLEHDDYFGAVFAAVGVGAAPGGYAQSDAARAGLARLRNYFKTHPAPDLHHQTWLLWASSRLDGMLTDEEQARTRKQLLARQRDNGGWSLAALGAWKRHDGGNNEVQGSDGYATGLIVYVLIQTGMTAEDSAIARGVKWLETNQRQSGRWFTRSLSSDRHHYLTQAGTAFAVMALRAAGSRPKDAKGKAPAKRKLPASVAGRKLLAQFHLANPKHTRDWSPHKDLRAAIEKSGSKLVEVLFESKLDSSSIHYRYDAYILLDTGGRDASQVLAALPGADGGIAFQDGNYHKGLSSVRKRGQTPAPFAVEFPDRPQIIGNGLRGELSEKFRGVAGLRIDFVKNGYGRCYEWAMLRPDEGPEGLTLLEVFLLTKGKLHFTGAFSKPALKNGLSVMVAPLHRVTDGHLTFRVYHRNVGTNALSLKAANYLLNQEIRLEAIGHDSVWSFEPRRPVAGSNMLTTLQPGEVADASLSFFLPGEEFVNRRWQGKAVGPKNARQLEPGKYRLVVVRKFEAGPEAPKAWTGMIAANPVEIELSARPK